MNINIQNTKTANQSFNDFEDLLGFLDGKYYDMIENTNKLDDLFWDMEKEGISARLISSLEELVNMIDSELNKLFAIEKLIYKEMKNVLPEQSSAAALQFENESIIKLLDTVKSILSDKEDLKTHKDLLQAEMIASAELIQRNIHKKGSVLFHEARTLIPKDRLDGIIQALKAKNISTA